MLTAIPEPWRRKDSCCCSDRLSQHANAGIAAERPLIEGAPSQQPCNASGAWTAADVSGRRVEQDYASSCNLNDRRQAGDAAAAT